MEPTKAGLGYMAYFGLWNVPSLSKSSGLKWAALFDLALAPDGAAMERKCPGRLDPRSMRTCGTVRVLSQCEVTQSAHTGGRAAQQPQLRLLHSRQPADQTEILSLEATQKTETSRSSSYDGGWL